MADFIIGADGYPVPTEMPTRPQYANQSPFPASEWRQDDNVNDGYPYTLLTAERPEKAFVQPYPYATWRVEDGWNRNYPFHLLQPDIPHITMDIVKQRPYICLFRYDTPQDGFDGHGMFVLTPTSCKITEELNGRYEISMEHPIDAEGRWQYIRENYIIKAMGQLFTIRTVQQIWKGASGKIVAKGDHIFYQCGDGMIRRGDTGITGTSVASICREAVRRTDNEDREGLFHYQFTGISNMSVSQEYVLYYLDWLPQDTNMVDFIMGSRGMLEACEGEIHRDNFDYSIYSRKQGTFDNAFDIRIGKNLTGIKRTIDITTQATYLDAYNNYNWGISRDLTVSDMQRYGIPHHIVKRKDYSYNINVDGKNEEAEEWKYNIAKILLKMDSKRDFNNYCCPLVGYEIDMKEVKNNPDYSEVVDLGGYTVGNGGKLYDEYMGEIDIRITKTTTNAITGEVEQVTFGGLRTFVGQPAKTAVIDVEPEIVNIYFQVMDAEMALCYDRNGDMIIEYEGV